MCRMHWRTPANMPATGGISPRRWRSCGGRTSCASRSGATILGAVFFGCSRAVAAEFSFFMAIPVMFGASLLEIVKYGLAFSMQEIIVLLVGMVVAFTVSMLAIKFLMSYIRRHDFKLFGWYRIVLGIIVLAVFALLS